MNIFGLVFTTVDIFFLGIAVSLGILLLSIWIQRLDLHGNRKLAASDKYDATIKSILEGIYPDTSNWGGDINNRLKKSIPPIELAVNQFKRFTTCKDDIGTALQDYKDCCYETTYEEDTKFILYPKKGEVSPKEIFKSKVKALLKYAEKP